MRQITDEDVYRYLLGEVVIGDLYNSPIPGRKDDTPSFKLYVAKNGQIRWRDFGMSDRDQQGSAAVNLLQYMRRLPLGPGEGYHKAQNIINTEIKVGMIGKPPTQFRRKPQSDSIPYVGNGKFQDYELAYWKRFGITEQDLLLEDIHPLRKMSWEGEFGIPSVESKPSDPAFIYWWNHHPASYKIYRPLTPQKRDKFRQYNIDGVIEGWNTLKKGTYGFILSSTKDRLVVKKAFSGGITAINPRAEGEVATIASKKNELLNYAPRWVILYDADEPGYICSGVMTQTINDDRFKTYDMRGMLSGHKDFADFIDTNRGNQPYAKLREVITNIIR